MVDLVATARGAQWDVELGKLRYQVGLKVIKVKVEIVEDAWRGWGVSEARRPPKLRPCFPGEAGALLSLVNLSREA